MFGPNTRDAVLLGPCYLRIVRPSTRHHFVHKPMYAPRFGIAEIVFFFGKGYMLCRICDFPLSSCHVNSGAVITSLIHKPNYVSIPIICRRSSAFTIIMCVHRDRTVARNTSKRTRFVLHSLSAYKLSKQTVSQFKGAGFLRDL